MFAQFLFRGCTADGLAQLIEGMADVELKTFQAEQSSGKRSEPARLDERLAREAEQAIQALRGDAKETKGT